MADSTSTILIKLMPERSDTILVISTVHLYKPFQSFFFFFFVKKHPRTFRAQRRRGVLAGVFLYSNHCVRIVMSGQNQAGSHLETVAGSGL